MLEKLTRSFVARLRGEENPAVRRGMALALGALPRSLLCGLPAAAAAVPRGLNARVTPATSSSSGGGGGMTLLDDVIDALSTACRQERQPARRDAETRRNAAMALADVVSAVGIGSRVRVELCVDPATGVASRAAGSPGTFFRCQLALLLYPPLVSRAVARAEGSPTPSPQPPRRTLCEMLPGLTPPQLSRILGALISCTHDYATDNRGDVGSWVRKAALESLEAVLKDVQVRCPANGSAASCVVHALQHLPPPLSLVRLLCG